MEEKIKKDLAELELVNPAHLKLKSDGYGEFPDSYKLTEEGIKFIVNKIMNT